MYSNIEKIKIIGFDLDQTLYPKSPKIDHAIQLYLYKKISEHNGISIERSGEEFRRLYKDGEGMSGREILLAFNVPDASEELQQALEKAEIDQFLKKDDDTIDLLKKLKDRYHSIDIITGSNRTNTKLKLLKMGIEDMFDNIITEETANKRNGDAYKYWLELYKGLYPENFLYVGDRALTDYEIPRSLGLRSVLVNIPPHKMSEKVDCPQLESLKDLTKILL